MFKKYRPPAGNIVGALYNVEVPRFLEEPTVHSQIQPFDITVNNLNMINIIFCLFKILLNIITSSVSTSSNWSFPLKHFV